MVPARNFDAEATCVSRILHQIYQFLVAYYSTSGSTTSTGEDERSLNELLINFSQKTENSVLGY
jgi:hypothetical protein